MRSRTTRSASDIDRHRSMRQTAAYMLCAVAMLAGCVTERHWVGSMVSPSSEQLVDEGRETYARACASCHGVGGRGDGPQASATAPPTDLTMLARDNRGVFPRERVVRVITGQTAIAMHGSREMPVWHTRFDPSASGATAAAALRMERWLQGLVAYLETLQQQGGLPSAHERSILLM